MAMSRPDVIFQTPPLGFPITCSARIRPPLKSEAAAAGSAKGERVIKDGKKVLLGFGEKDAFDFDFVYGADAPTSAIYERDITKWLRSVIQGYHGAVVAFGETGSGKTHSLQGGAQSLEGIVPVTIRALFELLRESVRNADAQLSQAAATPGKGGRLGGAAQNAFTISMQFCEVYNDEVHDLLDPTLAGLRVENSEYGPRVTNLTRAPLRDENEFLRLYFQASANRTQNSSEFGPLAARASCFLFLDLIQTSAPRGDRKWSRLQFVELGGAEKLSEDPNALRAREGVALTKDVIAVGALLHALSDPMRRDFANYSASKTTQLLEDVFGGNCVTLCLVTLTPDVVTSATPLRFSQMLRGIENYPQRNEEFTNGLLRVMRTRVLQALEETHLAHRDAKESLKKTAADVETQVVELQGRLVRSDEERLRIADEKRRLYTMYVEVRNKFAALVETKTQMQAELLRSEEERLAISKLLIDVQMDGNSTQESAANDRYRLETRLLLLEGEIVEAKAREEKLAEEKLALQNQVKELLADKRDMDLEYVALKQNFMHVNDDLAAERAKTEKIGVELLNLVNARQALETQNQRMQMELQQLRSRHEEMSASSASSDQTRMNLQQSAAELKAQNERLTLDLIRKDVELKGLLAEFESRKTGLEKNAMELAREREQELLSMRQTADRESKMRLEQSREFDSEKRALEAEVRSLKRSVADLDAALNEATELNTSGARDLEATKVKLARLSEQYRSKLLQYMNEITDLSSAAAAAGSDTPALDQTGGGVNGGDADGAGAGSESGGPTMLADGGLDLQPAMQKMHKDLLRTHRERETELQDELDIERRLKQAMSRKLRLLITQYRVARDRLMDFEANNPSTRLLSDQDLKSLGDEVLIDEKRKDSELATLSLKLSEAREEIGSLKEAALRTMAAHSKSVTALSKKLSALQEENQILLRAHQKSSGDESGNIGSDLRAEHAQALQQLRDLQRELRDSMSGGGGKNAVAPDERLRKENATLRDENQRLRSENQELQDALASGSRKAGLARQQTVGGGDSSRVAELESEVRSLRAQLATAESSSSSSASASKLGAKEVKEFAAKSKEMERERASLQMRAMQAEEELKNFQQFFQTESMKKEQLIATLKKEVAMWKAKAGG